jgi:hypothetical protein
MLDKICAFENEEVGTFANWFRRLQGHRGLFLPSILPLIYSVQEAN